MNTPVINEIFTGILKSIDPHFARAAYCPICKKPKVNKHSSNIKVCETCAKKLNHNKRKYSNSLDHLIGYPDINFIHIS